MKKKLTKRSIEKKLTKSTKKPLVSKLLKKSNSKIIRKKTEEKQLKSAIKSNKKTEKGAIKIAKRKVELKSKVAVKQVLKPVVKEEKILKTIKNSKVKSQNNSSNTQKMTNPSSNQEGNFQVYSPDELKEFELLIQDKLYYTREELKETKDALSHRTESGTDDTSVSSKMLEDGAETTARETLNLEAVRMQKFIADLEAAMIRIKNGTYGRCIYTGKLIPKERLRAVPHTTSTVEGKKIQQSKLQQQPEELEFPPQDFVPEFNMD